MEISILYKFYWLHVWDPLQSSKESAFMWSIWHKAVAINEWKVCIVSAFISKQCVFCLPNMSESTKHKFWDCIQARRAWRRATFIMPEHCGVRIDNYDSFNWKQAIFGERIPKKYGRKIKSWHLLRGTSCFGTFGLNAMSKCPTTNNGMSIRVSTGFGMSSSFTARQYGKGWSKNLRLAASPLWPCSKGLTKLGALGMSFKGGTICILSGTESAAM